MNKLQQAQAFARNKTKNFFYGAFYPVIFSISTFLFWALDLQLVGFSINILAICVVLFAFDDALPTLPIVLLTSMSFRNSYVVGTTIIPVVIFGLALVLILFNLFAYPKKMKLDRLSIALIILTVSFLLGGSFTSFLKDFTSGLPVIFTAGIGMFAVHFYYNNRVNLDGDVDVKKYFCHSFLCAVNVACCQAIFAYVHTVFFGRAEIDGPHSNLFYYPGGFCWANSNHIASLILLAIPLCLYLITHTNSLKVYLFELIFLYFSIAITFSDGALAAIGVFSPALFYFTLANVSKKNFKPVNALIIILIAVVLFILIYAAIFNFDLIVNFIKKSADDNGRSPVYNVAMDLFLAYPIFGVGLGHGSLVVDFVGTYRGFFHSTFFHIAATCGLVGLLAFANLYVERFKRLIKNGGLLGFFATLGFLMFSIYALIENSELNIVVLYLTLMITFIGLPTKKAEIFSPLPLSMQYKNYRLSSIL